MFLNLNLSHQIAVLIDPEKVYHSLSSVEKWCSQIQDSQVDLVLVGGSTVTKEQIQVVCELLKQHLTIPLVLFPGSSQQITSIVDGVLLLNLISGDNSAYLIGHHVKAAPFLIKNKIPTLSTSYLLIDGGVQTSVERISKTTPLNPKDTEQIEHILYAGKLIGHQICYLEAGSGAKTPINKEIVEIAQSIFPFVIAGGGIRTIEKIRELHTAGANLVVIGNHLEENPTFINDLKMYKLNLSSDSQDSI